MEEKLLFNWSPDPNCSGIKDHRIVRVEEGLKLPRAQKELLQIVGPLLARNSLR